jgi:hypothetical protein
MKSLSITAVVLGLPVAALANAFRGPKKRAPDPEKASAVVEVFRTAWEGYIDHAFPNDTLNPISNGSTNDR